jgi:hypothetical protein
MQRHDPENLLLYCKLEIHVAPKEAAPSPERKKLRTKDALLIRPLWRTPAFIVSRPDLSEDARKVLAQIPGQVIKIEEIGKYAIRFQEPDSPVRRRFPSLFQLPTSSR